MGSEELERKLENHKDDWSELFDHRNDSRKFDEKLTDLESSALSVDVSKTYDILLSWGGPADGFKVDTDQDNELTGIRYWHSELGHL